MHSKFSIAYIIPYFGKLRPDINIWLKSCEYNKDIDFFLFTDDRTKYQYPENVKVHYIEYSELRKYVNRAMGFNVAMEKPYKLCDLKPAYGEVFQEYIEGYDFWGHCDMDLIWGDIRKFITDDVLKNYDKIGFLGHSTLYRNNSDVNGRYKLSLQSLNESSEKLQDYRYVFSHDENFQFDEKFINKIYEEHQWSIYKKVDFADLTEYRHNFFLTNVSGERNYDRQIFTWEKGKLIRHYVTNGMVASDEFMYIHFLKREMMMQINGYSDNLTIYPNIITDRNINISREFIRRVAEPQWAKYFYQLYKQKKSTITIWNLPRRILHRIKKYHKMSNSNENLGEH